MTIIYQVRYTMSLMLSQNIAQTKQFEGRQMANPDGLFEHYDMCLKQCPTQTFVLDSYCLNECPENYTYLGNPNNNGSGRCVPCIEVSKDGKCPTSCFGLKVLVFSLFRSNFQFVALAMDRASSKTLQVQTGRVKEHESFMGGDNQFEDFTTFSGMRGCGWLHRVCASRFWRKQRQFAHSRSASNQANHAARFRTPEVNKAHYGTSNHSTLAICQLQLV